MPQLSALAEKLIHSKNTIFEHMIGNRLCLEIDEQGFAVGLGTLHLQACVAEWLTPRTPELEVRGSSLACRVVPLDKELYSSSSLYTQVYNSPVNLGIFEAQHQTTCNRIVFNAI